MLLYLEWLLLGLAAISSLMPVPFSPLPQFSIVSLLCIVGFGLLGLNLPTRRLNHKVLYTALEFSIILLPILLQSRLQAAPLLGLIVVIRGCQMFQLPGRLIVAGLVFILFLMPLFWWDQMVSPHLMPKAPEPSGIVAPHRPPKAPEPTGSGSNVLILKLNVLFSSGLTLVFVLLLVNTLVTERQGRQELGVMHEQLRQYALKIESQATLQERNRIAREIHDALGHTLTAQSIQLENALLFCPTEADKTQKFLQEAKQLGSMALHEVRQSVATLRSSPLRGKSLEAAIAAAANEFYLTTGIVPDCTIRLSSELAPEISTALYRVIQEALMNICKHSRADQVVIYLQEKAEAVTLWIWDNGKGFEPDQNTTGFGLQGMRERTLALGGRFNLVSEPGKGCQVEVKVPLLMAKLRTTAVPQQGLDGDI
jgi:signal transduction histidine kinase